MAVEWTNLKPVKGAARMRCCPRSQRNQKTEENHHKAAIIYWEWRHIRLYEMWWTTWTTIMTSVSSKIMQKCAAAEKSRNKVDLVEESIATTRVRTNTHREGQSQRWVEYVGAQCNAIPKNIVDEVGMAIKATRKRWKITYSGHKIIVTGELIAFTKIQNKF